MTADAALLEAYAEWRRLAEFQGEAIRSSQWATVADCHARLSALHLCITRLADQARQEWRRTGTDVTEKENNVRRIIADLSELEMANNSFLTAAKEAARQQLTRLDGARQNLKRIQRSYSSSHSAMWSSFS